MLLLYLIFMTGINIIPHDILSDSQPIDCKPFEHIKSSHPGIMTVVLKILNKYLLIIITYYYKNIELPQSYSLSFLVYLLRTELICPKMSSNTNYFFFHCFLINFQHFLLTIQMPGNIY